MVSRARGNLEPASAQALILGHSHPSDTVLSLARQLGAALEANGVRATIINLSNRLNKLRLPFIKARRFDQVYFIGAKALSTRRGDQFLFDYFTGKCFFWVLDPIIYDFARQGAVTRAYFERAASSPRHHLLFPDRSYLELVRELDGGRSHYFSFGADSRPFTQGSANTGHSENRSPRVLIVGNIGKELVLPGHETLPDTIAATDPFGLSPARQAALIEALTRSEHGSNVATTVRDFLGIPSRELFTAPVVRFLTAVDALEKRRRRLSVVRALSLPADFVGVGWQEVFGERPETHYNNARIGHATLPALFGHYKVLLDFAPNWDDGFNDRVVTALCAGCRVVTSRNAATAELGDDASLVSTYAFYEPDPDTPTRAALEAPPIDAATQSRLRERCSWSGRVGDLLASLPRS